jgi:hypothetical protein
MDDVQLVKMLIATMHHSGFIIEPPFFQVFEE